MKALSTLIQLQKTRVDEQRVQLAKLQAHLENVEARIAALEIEKTREQIAAEHNREARGTYGAFVKNAVKRGRELEKERQAAIMAVEIARNALAELFEEQKRYEIADAARIEAAEKEEKRRERINLDEIGGITHMRKKDQ